MCDRYATILSSSIQVGWGALLRGGVIGNERGFGRLSWVPPWVDRHGDPLSR